MPSKSRPSAPAGLSSGALNISQVARLFNLSRSTLLYYDSIGLLKPAGRSRSNYRCYSREDVARLEMICMYRQIGLPMASIGEIFNAPKNKARGILEKRLLALSGEITRLREQQHMIVRMLEDATLRKRIPVMDKEGWIALLKAVGLDEEGMNKWHQEFEKLSPALHQEFLEGLGIPGDEIDMIRKLSRR